MAENIFSMRLYLPTFVINIVMIGILLEVIMVIFVTMAMMIIMIIMNYDFSINGK